MARGRRNFAALLVASLAGGCALAPETVDINYASRVAGSVPQDGAGALVEVRAIDSRLSHRDRIGTKKNGYGVELARITASRSPVELVRDSVQQELKSKGFAIGPGGVILTVELLDFYSDFKPAFVIPTADSAAEVSFTLQVAAPGGGSTFSNTYRGKGTSMDAFVMTPGSARVALEQALADAVQQVAGDANLKTALLTGSASGANVPVASKATGATSAGPTPAKAAPASTSDAVAPPPIDYGQGLSRSRL